VKKIGIILLFSFIVAALVVAQRFGGFGGRRGFGGYGGAFETARTAREIPSGSTGTPTWTNVHGFEKDVFTFARIRCDRTPGWGRGGGGEWWTDAPDSDLNLSWRLQQMTSLKVDPDGRFIRITDKDLTDYPWIYMVEPGRLLLRDEEVPILRRYLLNGGALMADDFWGERQWEGFASQLRRVFPDRDFKALPMEHPIFHCVFDLRVPLYKLQTPNIRTGDMSQYPEYAGVTWEVHDGEQCKEMHVRAITDDKGRIMIIATHNTDNGDGWEREGESHYFFSEFSEKRAYPLGINIIFYLMTH
jgi:hypothetical protein